MSAPAPSRVADDVVVLLVSHDGARWLPGVVEGLAEQTVAPGAVVVVDTGSRDESTDLLPADHDVVIESAATAYPEAVSRGLERIAVTHPDTEWVWLLHDDSRPAPRALARLLEAAVRRPDADLLGPKLREWPSLRRLLEVGVTLSGTGRRETGLERGEYDQGQHDQEREVLAVGSAGLLVRRRVLEELDGFDPRLPLFGNDLDLGWRAAAAGHTTVVVPSAVVFHAEAAHRGLRETALGGRTHLHERRAALYTLLVNTSAASLPWRLLRLTLGTFVRMLGFLVVRSPGEAADDLAALAAVVFRPAALRAGRRERRDWHRRVGRAPDTERVRRLLAPGWVPYRHGLDFLGDVLSAATSQAADVAERRRAAAAELDPSSQAAARVRAERAAREDDEDEWADSGAVARFFTNPVSLVLLVVVLGMLVAARTALGQVSGGALSPVPDDTGSWWSLHYATWHPLGFGTDVPAPPYVVVLALLATVLGPTATVSALLVLSLPLGLWGAFRFLRVAGRLVSPQGAPRWLLVGGATTYALAPVTAGAWGDGRLGLVVAGALLPWLAHAALGFADPDVDRRRRAGWRVGLLLAVVAAFAPVAWFVALALVAAVLGAGLALARSAVTARAVWGPPVAALGVPLVLHAPWWVPALLGGHGGALLLETGRAPASATGPGDLLTGRLGDLGAPTWVGLVLVVLALLALAPRASRIPVTLCWLVALVALLVAAVLSPITLELTGTATPPGIGAPLLVVQACLVTAVVLGAQVAARSRLTTPWRVVGVVAAVAALAVPVTGAAWWAIADDSLTSADATVVPEYMVQRSLLGPEHGVLVVRGSVADGLTYDVRRGDGVTLGEDEVLDLSDPGTEVTSTVRALLSRPTPEVVDRLGDLGIDYVLLVPPSDGAVASALDAASGLVQSSSAAGSRAWQVDRPLDPAAVDGDGTSWLRVLLLVVQGLALLVVLVLAAPTLRTGGAREQS